MAQDIIVHRVVIDPITKFVSVSQFGMERVDTGRERDYDCVDDLPRWIQEGIALLSMTSAVPPTEEVEGVGRRIEENIFWLYDSLSRRKP